MLEKNVDHIRGAQKENNLTHVFLLKRQTRGLLEPSKRNL